MATSSEEDTEKTLSTLFAEGLNLYNNLGKIDEPTNSYEVQSRIKNAMKLLEDATRLASLANLFSKNESIDEVPTEHIQYFLLPALLGSLSLKLISGDRKDIISAAEVYFKDFLNRCSSYGLTDYNSRKSSSEITTTTSNSEIDQITRAVSTRASKIQRFKEQKELKQKLQVLKDNLDSDHIDDEIKRKYYLTMVKLYIYEAVDELSSIDMEKPILEHMEKLGSDRPKPKRPVKPLKPVIITRDEMQKAVFGAGYPSLPTMTVQEFYDKRVRDGIFPDPNKPKVGGPLSMQEAALAGIDLNSDENEAVEKENFEEADDPDYIRRLRDKDEYKDDHRRGWGNRMNRS